MRAEGDAARLADAGRAQQGEVPSDQPVDIDMGPDRVVLLQLPDMDRVGTGDIEDRAQDRVAEKLGGVADRRRFLHSPIEARDAGGVGQDLAEQVEDSGRAAGGRLSGGRIVERDAGEHADHQRLPGPDAEEAADAEALVLGVGRRVRHLHLDGGLRTRNQQHPSQRLDADRARGNDPRAHIARQIIHQCALPSRGRRREAASRDPRQSAGAYARAPTVRLTGRA
jgi:hypothetical protein